MIVHPVAALFRTELDWSWLLSPTYLVQKCLFHWKIGAQLVEVVMSSFIRASGYHQESRLQDLDELKLAQLHALIYVSI